jgi:hypothetical protein
MKALLIKSTIKNFSLRLPSIYLGLLMGKMVFSKPDFPSFFQLRKDL